jgi:AcrR family transcriptional regulator
MKAGKKTKDYHHGDLRRAVIDAAWSLVARRGLNELTLREVARQVGVTHAAPYHHFKDREALLSVMTGEAFAEFDLALQRAKQGVSDPLEELYALGAAYTDFARERPERIEVMFRRKDAPDAVLLDTGKSTFQHLVDALVHCQEAGVAPAGDPLELALSAWSIVHGFAVLWVEGPLTAMEPYVGKFEPLRDRLLRSFGEWLSAAARETGRAHDGQDPS